jgi:hypothetical protein
LAPTSPILSRFTSLCRELETGLLDACVKAWGRRLLHIFDRGFAGSPWIGICLDRAIRFLLRWPKDYKLRDAEAQQT